MIDVQLQLARTLRESATSLATAGCRCPLALELRVVAEEMAGRVDRDELTFDEEMDLSDALDAAVEAVLPQVIDVLDDALTPRIEALPLHVRMTLTRARARHEFGLG